MTTIHKYPLGDITLPANYQILKVGLDPNNCPCLWAKVDLNNKPVHLLTYSSGTGWALPATGEMEHLGSFNEGPYVWHVFRDLDQHPGPDHYPLPPHYHTRTK